VLRKSSRLSSIAGSVVEYVTSSNVFYNRNAYTIKMRTLPTIMTPHLNNLIL
jgi:hypothetical protein